MDAKLRLYGKLSQLFDLNEDEAKRLRKIIKSYSITSKSGSTDFKETVKNFIETKKVEGIANSSLGYYKNVPLRFGKYFKYKKVETYTKEDIKKWLKKEEDSQLAQGTLYLWFRVIHRFFEYCKNEDIISINPCSTIKYKPGKSSRTFIPDEDVSEIKNACQTTFEKAVINFLLTTGCRVGEFPGIKLTDINFKDNTCVVTGKGSKTRVVMFDNETKKLLQKHISETSDKKHLFCKTKTVKKKGKRKYTVKVGISGGDIVRVVKDTAERAKIDYSVHPHLFRHTFATKCLDKGMDIITIQKLLGHSNIATTQIYAELNMTNVKKDYQKVFDK